MDSLREKTMISGQEDKSPDPLALTVIVEDTKNFTEPELVQAVAEAVIQFVPVPQHMVKDSSFSQWMQGRFRKLLKRMKPNYFAKLSAELSENNISYLSYTKENVNLIVVEPLPKSFTLPVLKRAQVSGLTLLPTETYPDVKMFGKAEIVINKNLNMSASKAAVAAAHALQLLRDDLFITNQATYEVLMRNTPLNIVWQTIEETTVDEHFTSVIRDAGLTEVEPGSITAAARMKGSVFLR